MYIFQAKLFSYIKRWCIYIDIYMLSSYKYISYKLIERTSSKTEQSKLWLQEFKQKNPHKVGFTRKVIDTNKENLKKLNVNIKRLTIYLQKIILGFKVR